MRSNSCPHMYTAQPSGVTKSTDMLSCKHCVKGILMVLNIQSYDFPPNILCTAQPSQINKATSNINITGSEASV